MWICQDITDNSRREQIKIVVIVEVTTWESVPQGIGSYEEAARAESTSHQRNAKGMRVVRYNVRDIAGLRYEGYD